MINGYIRVRTSQDFDYSVRKDTIFFELFGYVKEKKYFCSTNKL